MNKQIGRYQILEDIASGGQGAVYRAFDPENGQIIALKVLHPTLSGDRTYIERFRREASLAASIDHPNVVKIFEVGQDGDQHFMALEFLPESLSRVIESGGQMRLDRAAEFGVQIADGLSAAHDLGIIHRDVKPQNVLIGPDGTAKVTDFGIARAEVFNTMTATGLVMGTPHYMSPEQARGDRADARSDVYSLGCMLYHMLAGSVPFTGDTPLAVIRQQIEEQPDRLRHVRRDVPKDLEAIIERAMAKEPKKRFQTAADLGRALRGFAPGMDEPVKAARRKQAPPVTPAAQPTQLPAARPSTTWMSSWANAWQRSHRRRWAWLGATLTVSLAVVVIGARVGAWDRAMEYVESTSWFGVQAAARLASDLWEPGPSALPVDASGFPQSSTDAPGPQQTDGQTLASPQDLVTARDGVQDAFDPGTNRLQNDSSDVQPAQVVSADELAAMQGPLFDCIANVLGEDRASTMLRDGLEPSDAEQDVLQDVCRDQFEPAGLTATTDPQNVGLVANRDGSVNVEPQSGSVDEFPVPVARVVDTQRTDVSGGTPSVGAVDVAISSEESSPGSDPVSSADTAVVATAYDGPAIHVMANIDGKSQLMMRDNEAWWLHLELSAPGRGDSTELATVFNDEKWLPEWPDKPTTLNYDCQCESSTYGRLSPPLPDGQATVRIETLGGRGDVTGTIRRTDDEGYVLVVEFDDTAFDGSDWYEILVIAEEPPVNAVTVTASGSGMVRGATIRGVVTDAATGAPIANVEISAGLVEGDHTAWSNTESDGTFALTGLPAGLVDMNFNSDLYIDLYATIQVGALDSVVNANFTLDRGGSISGRVTDAETGLPIAHAWIEAHSTQGDGGSDSQTGSDGRYMLAGVSPGSYRIKAYAEDQGYVQQYYNGELDWDDASNIDVEGTETVKGIDFSLEKGATLVGQIIDSETNLPIDGVDLSAGPHDGEQVSWASTSRDGKYVLRGLPIGVIEVEVRSNRYIDQRQTFRLEKAGATLNADISLTRGASFTGRVVADTGLPVGNVSIWVASVDGGDINLYADTKEDGRFRIEGVPSGTYKVEANATWQGFVRQYYGEDGSWDAAKSISVQSTESMDGIDFKLARGATISGKVFDARTGQPIAKAWMDASPMQGDDSSSAETDIEGRYTIQGLASGAYRVKAHADSDGYVQQYYDGALSWSDAAPVTVKGTGAVNGIDFAMAKGVTLIGQVTDAENDSPVEGVDLSAGPIDQDQVAWATTGSDGKYTLTGLPAGVVTVDVWSQRHIGERVNLRLNKAGSTMSADFELERGATFSGTVVDATTGKPIVDAEVGAERVGGDGINVYAGTDGNGKFTMEGIAAGSYRIRVDARRAGYIEQYYEAKQFWDDAGTFDIVGTETVEGIAFEMVLGGAIAGRIVDAKTGVPVADAWIEATAIQGYGGANGNSDSKGWYMLTGVAPGNYRVKAYADGAGYIRQYYGGGHSSNNAGLITVNGTGTVSSVDIAMTRGASISGRITDAATGQPISGMDLSAGPLDGDHLAWDSTNSDGTFVLRGLPDGVIEVNAQGQGYLEVRKTVTIVDGKDVTDFNF